MTLPSGVICGVTSSLRLALRNWTEVAPLDVADLVGELLALLDQRLLLVGGDDARAGDDLALAVGLERRELEVEEAVRRGAEQREREASPDRSRSAPVAGRFTKLRVA